LHPNLVTKKNKKYEMLRQPTSADTFTEVYESICKGFAQLGLKMNKKDADAVVDTIKHITKLEEHLGKLLSLLKVFVDVGRQYNINAAQIDRENPKLMPSMLDGNNMPRKEFQQYIINHINKVTNTIDANVYTQNRYGQGLVNKVFPAFVRKLIEELDRNGVQTPVTGVGAPVAANEPYGDLIPVSTPVP